MLTSLLASTRRLVPKHKHSRRYHDYIRFAAPNGTVRVPLVSPKIIGVANSRGNRGHQEDFYGFAALSLDPEELKISVKKAHGIDWDPSAAGAALNRQVLFVGIYDGHGGSGVAQYLRQELHGLLESVHKEHIPELFAWVQELGGYFKRFKGGVLAPWTEAPSSPANGNTKYDLGTRITQTFFEVDRNISSDPMTQTCGATASTVFLHSLDIPVTPFFASKKLALTVAHCGDTRVMLCNTKTGDAFAMTENHHADARVESARLRQMAGGLMMDSFGETRWMGALANTRCLGDLRYKRFGVTPEPEVRTKLLEGDEWAYMVLVSDGVSSMVSDDEVVGIVRNSPDPKHAADKILSFAEQLGGEDNMTALVIPLSGWGKIKAPDKTKELREYRLRQAEGTERQRRM